MSEGFQTPITIKTAIDYIQSNKYLLPAIQRKFVWSHEQIEILFDSILRGYPINSFMLWHVCDDSIKNSYKFYRFIMNYREYFADTNEYINTTGVPDFYAVIDGQQRLTSLYVGLRGTYAYKMPRKWWKDSEDCIPTRRLYLNINEPVQHNVDSQKYYDFRFLKPDDASSEWFEVGRILTCNSNMDLISMINTLGIAGNQFAVDTLSNLYEVIHVRPFINYYMQEEQDSDRVLEVFVRTNSGGTSLSFSDLLMSIASANWAKIDARKEFDTLINEVRGLGRPSFNIDKDFILRTCLVLFVDDIRFRLNNFTHSNVAVFEKNWLGIKASIIAAFTLFEQLGFNDATFRAKNAAIPVIYYIYHKNIAGQITKPTYNADDRKNIARWLNLTFIRSIFSGQADSVLVSMRNVLKHTQAVNFPAQELMNAFKSNPTKNYSLDDDFIDGLLKAHKGSNEAFYVLSLLQPDLDFSKTLHQDHLHPASIFTDRGKIGQNIPRTDWKFASDADNWDSVANLQLLDGLLNSSKNDTPLDEWADEQHISKHDLFVPDDTSLKIKDFRKFINARRKVLSKHLKALL
ncbi:MAG: DUF262 domain-containing protein [Synergistaceae bacterium]|nr:DUF262 domain-containing protein [Synergistaceae bacterium]